MPEEPLTTFPSSSASDGGLPEQEICGDEAEKIEAEQVEAETTAQEPCLMAEVRSWSLGDLCAAILVLFAVFYTIYFARSLLFPFALAFLLNLICKPAVLWMRRWHVPTVVGAALIPLAFAGLLTLGVSAMLEPAQEWISRAPEDMREISDKIKSIRAPLDQLTQASDKVNEMSSGGKENEAVKVEVQQPTFNNVVLTSTGSLLSSATIVLTLLFFLLASGDRFLEKLVELMPTWSDKRRVVALTRDVQGQMSRYLFTISLINSGLGATIALGLWLIGIPNPILWGAMAALLNYIPFAGMVVGTAIIFFVGLVSFDTLGEALLAPLIYIVANGIEANLITPSLVGRSVSLNPVMVILSLFFWGWMWGIGGALLAIPLLVVFKIFCDQSELLKPFGVFMEP